MPGPKEENIKRALFLYVVVLFSWSSAKKCARVLSTEGMSCQAKSNC